MSTKADYEALDRELQAERSRAAEIRASLEAELQRLRERQAELQLPAPGDDKQAENGAGARGFVRKIWIAILVLIPGAALTGQDGLFQQFVAPWRCASICGDRGLVFVSLVRTPRAAENDDLDGCVCRGKPTAACHANPRPGVHICTEGITFSRTFAYVRRYGSLVFWAVLWSALFVLVLPPRSRAESS